MSVPEINEQCTNRNKYTVETLVLLNILKYQGVYLKYNI